MTDNPQIDPRLLAARQFLDEYAAALSRTSPGPMSHAARMLELLDAADEASGVRRVTAQELAGQLELARREAAVAALMSARDAARRDWRTVVTENDPYDEHQARHFSATAGWLKSRADKIVRGEEPDWPDAASSAADSPVGGVS